MPPSQHAHPDLASRRFLLSYNTTKPVDSRPQIPIGFRPAAKPGPAATSSPPKAPAPPCLPAPARVLPARPNAQAHAEECQGPEAAQPLRRHRMRLAEALRRHGVDEQMLAAAYADLVEKLQDKAEDRGVEKLLIEVLKECSRLLEKETTPAKSEWRAASIPIVVHNIPRPERGPQSGGEHNGSV